MGVEINVALAALVAALVAGVIQVAKGAGLPSRWAGLAALGCGVGVGAGFWVAGAADPLAAFLAGAVGGLMAAGVWSGTKAVVSG